MASASMTATKIRFSKALLLVYLLPSLLSVKVDEETKVFIRLFIENCNRDEVCVSIGPVHAILCGTRIRKAVGCSPRAFLVPDILLWDPLTYFPEVILFCPSCLEKNVQEHLHPIRCKDGSNDYDHPWLLFGLRNDTLLVGRVYLCRNKHQILSHDQSVLSQVKDSLNVTVNKILPNFSKIQLFAL